MDGHKLNYTVTHNLDTDRITLALSFYGHSEAFGWASRDNMGLDLRPEQWTTVIAAVVGRLPQELREQVVKSVSERAGV
jgi:hypothetical protein